MEAIVKYSCLNPLASCFIPSYIKKSVINKTEVPLSNLNFEEKRKTLNQESANAVVKYKSEMPKKESLDICLSYPTARDACDSKYSISKLLNENLYFTQCSMNFSPMKAKSSIMWSITDVAALLNFLFAALLSFYSEKKLAITYDSSDLESNNDPEESLVVESCDCPPMFGCIIPPNFFGNPFNLNSSCNKKCIHLRHYSETDQIARVSNSPYLQSNSTNAKEEKANQERCKVEENIYDCSGMSDIGMDIVKETPNYYKNKTSSVFQHTRYKIKPFNVASIESKETAGLTSVISSESDFFNLDGIETDMEIPKAQVIDDDFHPLLDEGISVEYDKGVVSPEIKRIIEIGFSPKYEPKLSFDPEEMPDNTTCNPPCSVWCDSLPQAAKDTYRRFIEELPILDKDLPSFSRRHSLINNPTFSNRPSYKRSFSANDSKKLEENIYPLQRDLCSEYRGGSRMYGRQMNNSFKQSMLNEKYYKLKFSPSSEKINLHTHLPNKNGKSGWGLFDGADSLWQSLPDCVQTAEHNAKDCSGKRVRELKR